MPKKRITEFIKKKFEEDYRKKREKKDYLFLKKFQMITEFSAMFKLYSDKRFYEQEFNIFLNESADKETLIKFCDEVSREALVYLFCNSNTKSITFGELINSPEKEKISVHLTDDFDHSEVEKYKKIVRGLIK